MKSIRSIGSPRLIPMAESQQLEVAESQQLEVAENSFMNDDTTNNEEIQQHIEKKKVNRRMKTSKGSSDDLPPIEHGTSKYLETETQDSMSNQQTSDTKNLPEGKGNKKKKTKEPSQETISNRPSEETHIITKKEYDPNKETYQETQKEIRKKSKQKGAPEGTQLELKKEEAKEVLKKEVEESKEDTLYRDTRDPSSKNLMENEISSNRGGLRQTIPDNGASTRRRHRMIVEKHPEMHIIGQIVSGNGFGKGGYACKWSVDIGSGWSFICGKQLGQTHVDYPSNGGDIIWSHPIDLHIASHSLQGWPRILLQVWHMDEHGRMGLSGYGFSHFPCCSGTHEMEIDTWRPLGSAKEEIEAFFLGGTTQLTTDEVLFQKAWSDRCRLKTVSSGKVFLLIDILLRHFEVPQFG